MNENPYEAPASVSEEEKGLLSPKPGPILIIITILLVAVNVFLCLIVVSMQGMGGSYGVGYITGRVLFFPILIVALFQIGKGFRNGRSRTKVFMWVSVFVLLSLLGNILSAAQGQM